MSKTIVAIAEQVDGSPKKIAAEVVSEAVRQAAATGGQALAITIGPGAAAAAASLGDHGVTEAVAIEGDSVATYSGEIYAHALSEILRSRSADLVLLGATVQGRDLLGRLGAHLDVAPAAEAIALSCAGDQWSIRRPVYAGKALLTVNPSRTPAVASLRGNIFPATMGQGATVNVETIAPAEGAPVHATLVERTAGAAGGQVELTEAEVVVAGGRGLKDPETFARLLEPLAETLGAAVGASRAVVDAGWRPHSEQVGQTGKTVAPKLYIACGISGAIQHLAGMRTSGTIVAINRDAEAPIFKVADYGIVGDVEEILPQLTGQLKVLLA